jgi:hypothetical protein
MVYRTVTQDNCPHDAKVKMAGFKDKYECTRCHKILPIVQLDIENKNKVWVAGHANETSFSSAHGSCQISLMPASFIYKVKFLQFLKFNTEFLPINY